MTESRIYEVEQCYDERKMPRTRDDHRALIGDLAREYELSPTYDLRETGLQFVSEYILVLKKREGANLQELSKLEIVLNSLFKEKD